MIKWNVEVGKAPAGVVMLPDNKRLLVALTGEDGLVASIRKDGSVTGRLQTGKGAHNFWPKGDGRHWFLSNRVEGTVSLIDTQEMKVVATISVPGGPDCMDITPDGKELWVTQRFLRRIAIVDLGDAEGRRQHSRRQVAARRVHAQGAGSAAAGIAAGSRGVDGERGVRSSRSRADARASSTSGSAPRPGCSRPSSARCCSGSDLMEWYEPAFNAVEFVMLGRRPDRWSSRWSCGCFERRWPLEKDGNERLVGVDRVYTVLNKLGIIPLLVFMVAYPITNEIEYLVRVLGLRAAAARTAAAVAARQRARPRSWSISCSTTSPPTGCIAPSTDSPGGGRCTACITASAG